MTMTIYIKPPKYPYTDADLRLDNPNTSFAVEMPDERRAEMGMFRVHETPSPVPKAGVVVEEVYPVCENGVWYQAWIERPETLKETEEYANNARQKRSALLSASDWTQLPDAPLTDAKRQAWSTYRQALRDITAQAGFPWNITWPANNP